MVKHTVGMKQVELCDHGHVHNWLRSSVRFALQQLWGERDSHPGWSTGLLLFAQPEFKHGRQFGVHGESKFHVSKRVYGNGK
jgi:hypothetical protein